MCGNMKFISSVDPGYISRVRYYILPCKNRAVNYVKVYISW